MKIERWSRVEPRDEKKKKEKKRTKASPGGKKEEEKKKDEGMPDLRSNVYPGTDPRRGDAGPRGSNRKPRILIVFGRPGFCLGGDVH